MILLAAGLALSACSDVSDEDDMPDFGPPSARLGILSGNAPQPIANTAPSDTVPADTAIGARISGDGPLVIAGEQMHPALLRQFYARHQGQPVWADRPDQAASLARAVYRAGDQGLDPNLFHADLLRRADSLAPLDRELVLSDAFLSYADALARGAVPVERRPDDQVLTPGPVDVAARLDDAIGSSDPGAAIDALAPDTPTYRALREALRQYRQGGARGAPNRLRTIEVGLERQRWLPRTLPADRAWVNVADQKLVFYRDDRPAFTTRVVVGEDVHKNQSPEFAAKIDASYFNPPWVIPADIVKAEYLPKISKDPDYLAKNNMVMLAGGEAEQLPGPEAGLGQLMFDMPNHFDVYLHDTPDRYIFNLENRRISHGCIRVQNPRDLAALLLQQPREAVDDGIAAGGTTRHDLPAPVPVFVVYETAFVDADGNLQFRPDFYQRDAAIWRQLHGGSEPKPVLQVSDPSAAPPVTDVDAGPGDPADRLRQLQHDLSSDPAVGRDAKKWF